MDHHWLATEFRSVVGAVVAPLDSTEMAGFKVTSVEAGHLASIRFEGAPTVTKGVPGHIRDVDTTPIIQAIAWTLERRAKRFAAGIAYDDHSRDWTEIFDRDFPGLFKCGIETSSGWADLLVAMAEQVKSLKPGEHFAFTQVKEKFGTLRAYHQGFTDEISDVIDAFEAVSKGICETCGGPGHLRRTPGHWFRTACDEHAQGADILVG